MLQYPVLVRNDKIKQAVSQTTIVSNVKIGVGKGCITIRMLTNVQFILNKMFTFLKSLVLLYVVLRECTFMYSILSPAFVQSCTYKHY